MLALLGGATIVVVSRLRVKANEGGKVVIPTLRPPLPQEIPMVFIFVRGCPKTKGHSAAGRIMSIKNSNRTRDLSACSAVPQLISPQGAPRVSPTL